LRHQDQKSSKHNSHVNNEGADATRKKRKVLQEKEPHRLQHKHLILPKTNWKVYFEARQNMRALKTQRESMSLP